jgi:hypothetical protein
MLREEHRLRVSENRVLRKIFRPKRYEVNGGRYTVRSFIICTHPQILGRSSQGKWGGRACGTHGRGEKSVQSFSGKARRKETTWKTMV